MKIKIQNELPDDYRPYTDKYFTRTRQIFEKEGMNPKVSLRVFTRGEGKVAGLKEAIKVFDKYAPELAELGGETWVTKKDSYKTKDPIMIVKGPAQSIVEFETIYLGVLSHYLSEAAGMPPIDTDLIREKFRSLKNIYDDIPITYFGARHYHFSLDKEIARAALEGGAMATSTDIGSSNINMKGVGTMPHFQVLPNGYIHGKESGTLVSAMKFDRHIDPFIPRVTLIDTFNKELDDTEKVTNYYGKRPNLIRIDTCGENIGQGGTAYHSNDGRDPSYETGKGVTIELARNVRNKQIETGFGEYTGLFLSSGFGNEKKAKAFSKANKIYEKETGYKLFTGVGIGEVSEARFATADIFEIEDEPFSKVGREVVGIDYKQLRRVI